MPNITDFQQDKFLRAKDLKERYSISNATLHRWVVAGKVPRPQYLNSQRVWRSSIVQEAEKTMLSDTTRKLGKTGPDWMNV